MPKATSDDITRDRVLAYYDGLLSGLTRASCIVRAAYATGNAIEKKIVAALEQMIATATDERKKVSCGPL